MARKRKKNSSGFGVVGTVALLGFLAAAGVGLFSKKS